MHLKKKTKDGVDLKALEMPAYGMGAMALEYRCRKCPLAL